MYSKIEICHRGGAFFGMLIVDEPNKVGYFNYYRIRPDFSGIEEVFLGDIKSKYWIKYVDEKAELYCREKGIKLIKKTEKKRNLLQKDTYNKETS